jgi:hypothetical protein
MKARHDANGRLEPLCVRVGTARVLPVFSFEQEVEMFLRLGGYYDGGGWRARESSAGELVSVLCGLCVGVGGVALDPLPQMLKDGTIGLVLVGRRRFVGGYWRERGASRARGEQAGRFELRETSPSPTSENPVHAHFQKGAFHALG